MTFTATIDPKRGEEVFVTCTDLPKCSVCVFHWEVRERPMYCRLGRESKDCPGPKGEIEGEGRDDA